MEFIVTENECLARWKLGDAKRLGLLSKNKKIKFLSMIRVSIEILKTTKEFFWCQKYKIGISVSDKAAYLHITPIKTVLPFAIKFNNEKELLTAICTLYRNGCQNKNVSSVYLLNNSFYLVIVPIVKDGATDRISREFSTHIITNGRAISVIQQEGKPICKNDAIGKLGESI